jgi:hypothetical protein
MTAPGDDERQRLAELLERDADVPGLVDILAHDPTADGLVELRAHG